MKDVIVITGASSVMQEGFSTGQIVVVDGGTLLV